MEFGALHKHVLAAIGGVVVIVFLLYSFNVTQILTPTPEQMQQSKRVSFLPRYHVSLSNDNTTARYEHTVIMESLPSDITDTVTVDDHRSVSDSQSSYSEGDVLQYLYPNPSVVHPATHEKLTPLHSFKLSASAASILNALDDLDYSQPLDDLDMQHIAVAVGASSNHFDESLATIATFQSVFPNDKIYFYDLGLQNHEVELLSTYCNVVIRRVNFDLYPPHVRSLRNYAFKLVVWQDMLRHHSAFIWMDASVRFDACFPQHLAQLKDKLINSGVIMLHPSPHSVYAVTTPSLYRYLPTDLKLFQKIRSYGGGAVMFARNQHMVESVMKWLTLCSLERDCSMPAGHSLHCHGAGDASYHTEYMHCHRYDMAILGILLANHFNFTQDLFTDFPEKCFSVQRYPDAKANIQVC